MTIGRPREFCTEKALDSALEVFWRKGYEGTSLSDLTDAMAITRPSLYAAYGNKEELFRKALDRYAQKYQTFAAEALALPDARAAIHSLLIGFADAQTEPCRPAGCLMVQGALACGGEADRIREELAVRRKSGETLIKARLQLAAEDGSLPDGADPAALARYFAAVTNGMAVQAASGVCREDLRQVAETAMKIWPVSPQAATHEQHGTMDMAG